MSNLEARLGVEPFHRKGRSIRLTAVGGSLYGIMHDLCGHEQDAIAYLNAARNLEVGELKFSAVAPYDVIDLLAVLHERRPGIKCSVT